MWFCASSAVGLADESLLFRPSSPRRGRLPPVVSEGLSVLHSRGACVGPALLSVWARRTCPPPPLRSFPHLCPADLKPRRLSSSVFGEVIKSGYRPSPSPFPLASVMVSPIPASPVLEIRQKVWKTGTNDRYFSSFTR